MFLGSKLFAGSTMSTPPRGGSPGTTASGPTGAPGPPTGGTAMSRTAREGTTGGTTAASSVDDFDDTRSLGEGWKGIKPNIAGQPGKELDLQERELRQEKLGPLGQATTTAQEEEEAGRKNIEAATEQGERAEEERERDLKEEAEAGGAPAPPPAESSASESVPEGDRRTGTFWSQTNWENFCRSTSMHGWFFVVDESLGKGFYGACTRSMWIIVVLLSIGLFLFFLQLILKDFDSDKVESKYVFHEGTWQDVDFPSVTLCNTNQASKSFLRRIGLESGGAQERELIGQMYLGTTDNDSLSKLDEDVATWLALDGHNVRCLYTFPDNYTLFKEAVLEHHKEDADITKSRCPPPKDYKVTPDLFRLAALQGVTRTHFLYASYRGVTKSLDGMANLHPFFETDVGFCSFIRPPLTFFSENQDSFSRVLERKRKRKTGSAASSSRLGRENGVHVRAKYSFTR